MVSIDKNENQSVFQCSSKLPNVFLIGDSIRLGYCKTVESELSEKAYVFYPKENCRNSQNIILSINSWAGLFDDPSEIDVILFNCGQWDTMHWQGYELNFTSESEYEKNLKMIIFLLHKFFPNAKLIFATTSKINPSSEVKAVNPRTNEEVDKYNSIAKEVMKECEIPVIDINSFMSDWPSECFVDLCHLTSDAYSRLGVMISKELIPHLKKRDGN